MQKALDKALESGISSREEQVYRKWAKLFLI